MIKKIAFSLIFFSLLATGCKKNVDSNNIANNQSSSSTIIQPSKTYINAEYGYSFQYPSDYIVSLPYKDSPDINHFYQVDIQKPSSEILVTIFGNVMPKLSEENVRHLFQGKTEAIVLTPIQISGSSAYKIISNSGINYYFLERPDKNVLEIYIPKNNTTSQETLNSFKFIQ